jgi:hypothetical protein
MTSPFGTLLAQCLDQSKAALRQLQLRSRLRSRYHGTVFGPRRAGGCSAATGLADDAAFDRPCVILRDCFAEFSDDAGRARGGARDLLADEAVREEMCLCV